ncbi:hypothetical protein [Streptococcus suis]|uniref:hypothetical protein n=1 Tax=Streptococcus suis TaxID=1307 RepID=UPI001960A694|nr:hypothetical protein [Streptococcus suis]MBM7191534.1 hypothetical protein [Streptococcus suis]MCO8223788.1 hypothetical protein [Streptococcus suis]HEM3484267.1 hypothetical protein [Streptococcus suis]
MTHRLIENAFLEEISDYKTEIIEHQEQQKFEMRLKISFPENGKIFKLGRHNPDDLGMNKLVWKKCPDGMFLRIDDINKVIDIFIFELKKTATSHLDKIPQQFHAGILRALSDIAIIHSPLDYSNDSFLINFRINYHFFIGTTITFNNKQPRGMPRTLTGAPNPEHPRLIDYQKGIVKMNCDAVGEQDVAFKFKELFFNFVKTDSNGVAIYNFDHNISI